MIKRNKNKMKGFTLVELLAVIVILAIILVIAVPKVMSVIEDSKKATLESTAKMIASAAEKAKVQNTVLGKETQITCDSVAKINKLDYEDCDIDFDDNTAKVTIKGSGKFEGLHVCEGTKTSASATEEECSSSEQTDNISPGLYETGSNYKTLLKDWDTLIEEEIFYIDNGVLMRGEIAESEYEDWNNALSGELKLPDDGSIILIGEETFARASNLTGVIIPNGVISIGYRAFEDCSSLTSITIPDSVTSIGDFAFAYCVSLTNVAIPNSVTSIGIAAFYVCTGLTSVTLSNNVTSIEYSTFGECTSLKSVTIPNSIISIGEYVFSNCTSLTSIIIGNSVTSIGKVAFGGCTSLTDIYYTGKEEEWNSITIGSVNEPLTTGTMHYEHVVQ